jgi:hypothetical protein
LPGFTGRVRVVEACVELTGTHGNSGEKVPSLFYGCWNFQPLQLLHVARENQNLACLQFGGMKVSKKAEDNIDGVSLTSHCLLPAYDGSQGAELAFLALF